MIWSFYEIRFMKMELLNLGNNIWCVLESCHFPLVFFIYYRHLYVSSTIFFITWCQLYVCSAIFLLHDAKYFLIILKKWIEVRYIRRLYDNDGNILHEPICFDLFVNHCSFLIQEISYAKQTKWWFVNKCLYF